MGVMLWLKYNTLYRVPVLANWYGNLHHTLFLKRNENRLFAVNGIREKIRESVLELVRAKPPLFILFRCETIIFWHYITSVLALCQLLTEVQNLGNIFAEKNCQSKFPWRFVEVASQRSDLRQNHAVQNKPIRSVENDWVLCFYF